MENVGTLDNGRVLVVGGTGILGGEIVRLLRKTGKNVRATVRPSSSHDKVESLRQLAVDLTIADLKDTASLNSACEGAISVIATANSLLSRAGGDDVHSVDERGLSALVAAARMSSVKRFVFVSFPPVPLDYEYQKAKRLIEGTLRESGIEHVIIQLAPLMEIWLSPLIGFDPIGGSIRVFGNGNGAVSWVSIHDAARLAVAATGDCDCLNQTIVMGGPEALSQSRVSEIFAELGTRQPTLEKIPEAALESMFQNATSPIEKAMAANMLVVARGIQMDTLAIQKVLPGRLKSVREYAGEFLRGSASQTKSS